jgi:hypothetical protein
VQLAVTLKKSNLRVLMRGDLGRKSRLKNLVGSKKSNEKGTVARNDFKGYLAMQNYMKFSAILNKPTRTHLLQPLRSNHNVDVVSVFVLGLDERAFALGEGQGVNGMTQSHGSALVPRATGQ